MKKLLMTVLLTIVSVGMTASEIHQNLYLKISLSDSDYISYPPGTNFLVSDTDGNTILTEKELTQVQTYTIENPITLYVFTTWNEEPDVYDLQSGTLSMEKTDRTYKNTTPKNTVVKKLAKDKHITSNNVYLIKKRYFGYDETNGYNVSLEFSNGVTFLFRDGKAAAWENGKSLPVKNKYIVETPKGDLKISYHPKTKKVWWVFDRK